MNFKAETVSESPLERPRTQQGIDFDYATDRNAIGRTKIKTFNFSAGFGGTLTLGGTANGNGLMLVKDSSGDTIVTVDNAGIVIEGGNLVVKNSSNTTIIDTAGLVSTANFPTDEVVSASTNTTTSESATDLPGSTLDSFVLTRTAKVLVLSSVQARNDAFGVDGSNVTAIVHDSASGEVLSYPILTYTYLTDIDETSGTVTGWSYDTAASFFTAGVVLDMNAGTHTLKLQYNRNGSSGTAIVSFYQLAYVVLGS